MKILFAFAFVLSSLAHGELEWQRLKALQEKLKFESAVAAGETSVEASGLRAKSQALEAHRISDLFAKQSVTEAQQRAAVRDRIAAEVTAAESLEKLTQARNEKAIAALQPGCVAGNAADCQALAGVYRSQLQSKVRSAANVRTKARADLDFARFQRDAIARLVAVKALDPSVLLEEDLDLAARESELKGAEIQLHLAKRAAVR